MKNETIRLRARWLKHYTQSVLRCAAEKRQARRQIGRGEQPSRAGVNWKAWNQDAADRYARALILDQSKLAWVRTGPGRGHWVEVSLGDVNAFNLAAEKLVRLAEEIGAVYKSSANFRKHHAGLAHMAVAAMELVRWEPALRGDMRPAPAVKAKKGARAA
jgi:hypothetical protein